MPALPSIAPRLLALVLLLPMSVILPNAASAQERASGNLEEVLVTARKRSENIQETPVAVTAMTSADLRDRGIINTDELAKSVPSLQINNSTSTQIFIRGVGQRAGLVRQDPSVSVYLDGIFIPRADGQLLDTIDIETIQVLRGPQGTLFGKNNTGGALVFTLTKPGEDAGAYVEAAMGNFGAQRIRGAVDIPFSDTFFARFALNSNRRDGFLKDLSVSDTHSVDRLAGIIQTRWEPAENLTLDTFGFFGKIRERYPSYHCTIANPDALFVNGLGLLWPGDTDPGEPKAYRENCEANSRDNLPDLTTNMGSSQRHNKYLNNMMAGATLDWSINDNLDLKTIIGIRDAVKKGPQTNSDDGGPGEFQTALILGSGDQESFTIEFQLNGAFLDEALEFTSGFFWQQEHKSERFLTGDSVIGIDSANLALVGAMQRPNPSAAPPGGTNPPIVGLLLPMNTVQDFDIDGNTIAIFSQLTWHINDNLEFTFGGRYTEESRESNLQTRVTDNAATTAMIAAANPRFTVFEPDQGLMSFAGTWSEDPISIANDIVGSRNEQNGFINTPLGPTQNFERDTTFSQFTPMLSSSWIVPSEWLEDSLVNSMMVYATYSNGFKSGFLEPKGSDGLLVVKPEILDNREIGFKIDALQRSLRINVAAYSMIFQDMQLITVDVDSAGALAVTTDNAGESIIEGAELEVTWLPSPNLMLTFSYSNNNYKFEEFTDKDLAARAIEQQDVILDRSDEQFPVSPEVTAAFGIQYTFQTDYGFFVPRLDLNYKGEIYLGFDNGAWDVRHTNREGVYADGYTLADLRFSWRSNEGDHSLSAYIKNVTDERYLIGAVATGDSIGTFTQALGEPRLFGIEYRREFQ